MLLNGFLYYIGRFIIYGAMVAAGVFTGIKLRKNKDAKAGK